ncbi:MAG: DUF6231 family protein [Gammaproteobacteria bacterium]|nr:DUF6231 family protein [Gammaproteobacteria bacterium]
MQRRVREDLRRILAGVPGGDSGALLLSPRGDLAEHLAAGAAPGRETLSGDVANYCETPRLRRRFAVGIVVCAAADMANTPFEHLISRLRDQDCERVYLYRPGEAAARDDNFLRALGLRLMRAYAGEDGDTGGRLYYFDIFDYKDAPDWLNSRFWANPQMWDKARW